jgi:hypothetical protein
MLEGILAVFSKRALKSLYNQADFPPFGGSIPPAPAKPARRTEKMLLILAEMPANGEPLRFREVVSSLPIREMGGRRPFSLVQSRSVFHKWRAARNEIKGLHCTERLIDVGDNVVRMLDADRKPHIPLADTGLQLLFW